MTAFYIVVFYFQVYGFSAQVLPQQAIAYRYKSSCEKSIPKVAAIAAKTRPSWMPQPKSVTCEKIELAKIKPK